MLELLPTSSRPQHGPLLIGTWDSEELFRTLFDGNPVPMWIYDPRTFKIRSVNESAVRHYGFSRAEFATMLITDLCPSPEIAAALAYRTKMFESDIPAGMSRTVTWKQKKKDGSVLDVELTSSPISMPDGRGVLVFANDITERKRSEKQIHEQTSLLNLANDAIFVTDLDDRIMFWNKGAETLFGWPTDEALGRTRSELLTWESQVFETAKHALNDCGDWTGESSLKTRNGRQLTVISRWTLVRDEDGAPKSILIINTDITEKKSLERQFLRAQRLESIGTLASGIAHDLNNILAPILMSIGLLRRAFIDADTQKLLTTIEASAERGADIVRQVLTFARGIEGERIVLQPRHLINDLVKIMVQTFPKNIEIKTQFPKDLWQVTGDATQLHQVLLNLCVNARDAMPHGGKLVLAAQNATLDEHYVTMNPEAVPGSFVMLQVSDTGIGIPAETIDKIFDPFFTTKEQGKGTGLGLSTVLGIVKSHGGFVSLESRVGEGTTFRVCIPAVPSAVESGSAAQSGPAAVPRGNGELILVVDDEPAVRMAATRTLETNGYRIFTAEDGTDGLALYFQRSSEIALVLTDIEMDLMDGVALVRSLKRVDAKVRVIVSTGQARAEQRNVLRALGVKMFLDKPYTADQLLRAVHEVLSETAAS
jgi:PAS domain S-box-containing protein